MVAPTLSLVSVCISAMKSRSSLMYCLMHSMAAVVHCWQQNQFIHSGKSQPGLLWFALFFRGKSKNNPNTRRLKSYPWQCCDHVLLDDGGFRQACANICTNKLRNATRSVNNVFSGIHTVAPGGVGFFSSFLLPGQAVASLCQAAET